MERGRTVMMNVKKIKTILFVAGCLVGGSMLGAWLLTPHSARAQFSAQSTWIAQSNIGGGANAVTFSNLPITQLSDLVGVPLRFLPTNTNAAGPTTITPATGLNPVTVERSSGGTLVPIAGGDFTANTMAEVIYDGTEFVQTNPATGTDPVGTEKAFTGASAQVPAGHLFEDGTCKSQTTYAALYASYGSTDLYSPGSTGGACPGGQFHVKFANGRASVAADTQNSVTASVLTTAGSGCGATTVGVNCGAQNHALSSSNQLPSTPITGTVSTTLTLVGGVSLYSDVFTGGASNEGATSAYNAASQTGAFSVNFAGSSASSTFTGASIGSGSPSPFTTVQPTSTVYMLVKY
jgi:hypothetical protein